MVTEDRRLGSQRLEQGDLHAGVGDVVVAADDMADAHLDVVDNGGQRIEIRAVLAHQDRIGQRGQIDGSSPRTRSFQWTSVRSGCCGSLEKLGSRKRQCGRRPSAWYSATCSRVSASASRP